MDIRNPTEFRNYIQANGLGGVHPDFAAAANCIGDYERGCNCWKGNEKEKLYQNCKVLYVRAVASALGYKAHFMQFTADQQLTFYLDNRPIGSMRR